MDETATQEIYLKLKRMIGDYTPDFELRYKAELAAEINRLKVEKNAVILGHNYMEPALFHSIPDFVGDSLELSRRAAATDKDIIVFCGVRFMGETAKILNPSKTVLLPAKKAGCSLAESITAADVRALKERFPGVPVVTYVNTYADVKAESDICCTSGNAVAVVNSLKGDTVIFLPDEYLAGNVARETGKHIIFPSIYPKIDPKVDYQMIGWHGRCEVHEKFTVDDIRRVRAQFPDVIILAHPECSPEVTQAADFAGSTDRDDPLRRAHQRAALSDPDRMLDERQHCRRQPRQRDAAAVLCSLPAHERNYAGRYAQSAPTQPLRDRSAGGNPGACGARGGTHDRDWVMVDW